MNQVKLNNIFLVLWTLLLVFSLMNLLYNPLKFNFLVTGYIAGMFLHMLLITPLLNFKDKYINFLNEIINGISPNTSKTYIRKVTESFSGKGYPAGRINYVPKEFIGKKVEVRLKSNTKKGKIK